jgi:hypothetical protein
LPLVDQNAASRATVRRYGCSFESTILPSNERRTKKLPLARLHDAPEVRVESDQQRQGAHLGGSENHARLQRIERENALPGTWEVRSRPCLSRIA